MTLPPSDLVLASDRVVTPDGVVPAFVTVAGGVITGVVPRRGAPEELAASPRLVDVGERAILPGLVDTHVHVNEPGRTDWEGFVTATRAAAAGGVTTLVDMPLNSSPVTTMVAALNEKRRAAQGKCWVDVGFHGGLIPGNRANIEPLINAGVLGVKAFLVHSGIDEFPNAGIADLRAAMPILARRNIPLLVHAEWDSEDAAPSARGASAYSDYLKSRPPVWETRAIEKLLALCAEYRCPLHIVHLSASEGIPLLAAARASGLPVTVETAPHYLHFTSEAIPNGDTRFKCAPPIRSQANREKLWDALRDGVIDSIASDHSPCPPGDKRLETGDFGAAWGGIASLQSELPVIWNDALQRGFSLSDIACWMAQNPACLVGLQGKKGVIAVGADADLVIFEPESFQTVSTDRLQYRHKLTPYENERLQGVVRQTYLRGELVYDDGAFRDTPFGTSLERTTP